MQAHRGAQSKKHLQCLPTFCPLALMELELRGGYLGRGYPHRFVSDCGSPSVMTRCYKCSIATFESVNSHIAEGTSLSRVTCFFVCLPLCVQAHRGAQSKKHQQCLPPSALWALTKLELRGGYLGRSAKNRHRRCAAILNVYYYRQKNIGEQYRSPIFIHSRSIISYSA